MALFDDKREEIYTVGDANRLANRAVVQTHHHADPDGDRRYGEGVAQQINLDHAKITALVRYQDHILEVDVYTSPSDATKVSHVELICPRCKNVCRVSSERKAIDWRPAVRVERVGDMVNMGELSIEPFTCTWETPDAGAHVAGGIRALNKLCRLRIGITKNQARDA